MVVKTRTARNLFQATSKVVYESFYTMCTADCSLQLVSSELQTCVGAPHLSEADSTLDDRVLTFLEALTVGTKANSLHSTVEHGQLPERPSAKELSYRGQQRRSWAQPLPCHSCGGALQREVAIRRQQVLGNQLRAQLVLPSAPFRTQAEAALANGESSRRQHSGSYFSKVEIVEHFRHTVRGQSDIATFQHS